MARTCNPMIRSHILYPFALLMTLCFRRQPSDPAAFRSRFSVSARRKEVSTWIDRVQKSCGKIESVNDTIRRFNPIRAGGDYSGPSRSREAADPRLSFANGVRERAESVCLNHYRPGLRTASGEYVRPSR